MTHAPTQPTKRRERYPPTWQELSEREDRERYTLDGPQARADAEAIADVLKVTYKHGAIQGATRRVVYLPPWKTLEAEAIAMRALFCTPEGREKWASIYDAPHYRAYETQTLPPPEAFSVRNIQHFQYLPSIERLKNDAANIGLAVSLANGLQNTYANKERIIRAVLGEQAHLTYHRAMWRAHGRRVLVLDDTTYRLLAHTELPALPASILSSPWHSFYVTLPPRAFEFEVQNVRTQGTDTAYVEGVAIAIDNCDPDFPGTRELSFMVMGEEENGQGSEGRNCAFISVRLGPDALLSSISFDGGVRITQHAPSGGYALDTLVGSHDLGVTMPRVVLGLLLYLASEHPDLVPVPPAPRRDFKDVRNETQRARALQRQADELRGATSLPLLLVGSHTKDTLDAETSARQESDAASGKRWSLDHAVWVRGHWRQQRVGPQRTLRRLVWIRPFVRGPDAAESMHIRAQRLQRATLNHEPSQRER